MQNFHLHFSIEFPTLIYIFNKRLISIKHDQLSFLLPAENTRIYLLILDDF